MAVETILPNWLFAPTSPPEVKRRVQDDFLKYAPEFSVKALEPLYKMDVQNFAKEVSVPVRTINSDFQGTNKEVNQKYFKDYDVHIIKGTGHYPMLEDAKAFNSILLNLV